MKKFEIINSKWIKQLELGEGDTYFFKSLKINSVSYFGTQLRIEG